MKISYTNTFKKQLKAYQNNIKVMSKLQEVFGCFIQGNSLPHRFKDHQLQGPRKTYREGHLLGDVLLIYEYDNINSTITLVYIGSHSDLFK